MDREQAEQLSLFGWIVAIFITYPTLLGGAIWWAARKFEWPPGLMVIGILAGLVLATIQLIARTRKNEDEPTPPRSGNA